VLVLNIFIPGAGTIYASYYDYNGFKFIFLVIGLIELTTAIFMFGFILSVI